MAPARPGRLCWAPQLFSGYSLKGVSVQQPQHRQASTVRTQDIQDIQHKQGQQCSLVVNQRLGADPSSNHCCQNNTISYTVKATFTDTQALSASTPLTSPATLSGEWPSLEPNFNLKKETKYEMKDPVFSPIRNTQ